MLPSSSILIFRVLLLSGLFMGSARVGACSAEPGKTARGRTFFFTYAATVKGLATGKKARIWIPVPRSSTEQDARLELKEGPGTERRTKDSTYGNDILYMEAKADAAGRIPVLLTYQVTRREVTSGSEPAAEIDRKKVERFLQADEKVPIGGKPLVLLKGKKIPEEPVSAAKAMFEVVREQMRYSKEGSGWGRGDAVWACDSGFGNCTDFHSLFISLARSRKIAAKFEIGFALPDQRGAGRIDGYHCWAWFLPPGKGWMPVDISQAKQNPGKADYYFGNLSENRIAFTVGRDITLNPPQKEPPLNFFIYPHVEVDGHGLPAGQVETVVSFQDLP